MMLREAWPEERPLLYEWGHREWPKNRTLAQYIEDNQKEEAYGTRFVLVADDGEVAASLMLLKLRPYLYGLGSIVVAPAARGRGVGTQLLTECLQMHKEAAFMLYSEIGTSYYERFGFTALPDEYQRYPQGICMVKAPPQQREQIMKEPIPDYF